MARMKLGVIGLGKMGLAIAQRALNGGHTVIGFNHSASAMEAAQKIGISIAKKARELAQHTDIIWLMVPPTAVESVLQEIKPTLRKAHIIVDGGNSYFKDSIVRAKELEKLNIFFLDCGTSGGLQGNQIGFSLMVGGDKKAYEAIVPLLQSLAAPNGYGYMGPSGAGHYVKMIHNGIEYALMQSYAEGFDLLKNGHFKDLDLEKISSVWNNGSIIRSWLLQLCNEIFKSDQNFNTISGKIEQTGMGKWTVNEAHEHGVPAKLIDDAVAIRQWSENTGGNYATKIVALLRNKFGGHAITKIEKT